MSKHNSNIIWSLLLPIGMLIVLVSVFIRKRGDLESFDLLVMIILALMLVARLIEWIYRKINSKDTSEEDRNVIDDRG